MSKNVAVFVDVANIFYAAKAAGVDIDYVTLLKSATAGRDFVRAYAYTGLDPENENQRQFHAFLGRSGYKVISKDIRKYGDGRIKANLDIELVVDMMRMADHLDIAVVISGDGDFAPAIRAVQQRGVRVEVVSFRGNTSSDLIDVADVFIDITHVARVEKGDRSGRRVAAEGDLSMTEVPEKETEGPARRRRGGTGRRVTEPTDVVAGPVDAALPGNVIVLPGERLSRAEGSDIPDQARDDEEEVLDADGQQPIPIGDVVEGEDAEGRRRRRRRGGRGRGRGRHPDGEPIVGTAAPMTLETVISLENAIEEEEFLDEIPVALPQHSTFGSVWDSQLGVPTAPPTARTAAATDLTDDEDDEDEPEIPEYLLAERRQAASRQQRGRGGPGRGGSYRTALDRERYGRGGMSSYSGGGGNMTSGNTVSSGMGAPMRSPDRGQDRGRSGRDARPQQRPPQQGRPAPMRDRAPYREPATPAAPVARPSAGTGAEPWSEVPLEVQELLKAELARRAGRPDVARPRPSQPATRQPAAAPTIDASDALGTPAEAPTRAPSRRAAGGATTRSDTAAPGSRTAASAAPVPQEAAAPSTGEAPPAPARTRRATARPARSAADPATPMADAAKPAKPARATRASAASTAKTASSAKAASSTKAASAVKAPAKRTAAPASDASASDVSAPKPRRRTAKQDAATTDG